MGPAQNHPSIFGILGLLRFIILIPRQFLCQYAPDSRGGSVVHTRARGRAFHASSAGRSSASSVRCTLVLHVHTVHSTHFRYAFVGPVSPILRSAGAPHQGHGFSSMDMVFPPRPGGRLHATVCGLHRRTHAPRWLNILPASSPPAPAARTPLAASAARRWSR